MIVIEFMENGALDAFLRVSYPVHSPMHLEMGLRGMQVGELFREVRCVKYV